MAVVSVKRTFEESGDASSEEQIYLVVVNSYADTCTTAINAAGIPREGSALGDTSLRAKVSAKRNPEFPFHFNVSVRYEIPAELNKDPKPEGDGVKWNLRVSSRGLKTERPAYVMLPGETPVNNKAGYAFSPPPSVPYYDEEITVSFNTDDGSIIEAINGCRGRKSSDAFHITFNGVTRGFPAATVRLEDATWDFDYVLNESGQKQLFWNVTLIFWYRVPLVEGDAGFGEDGSPTQYWYDIELANVGFVDVDGNPILDENNQPVTEPFPLDSEGHKLASGDVAFPIRGDVKIPAAMAPLLAGIAGCGTGLGA